MFQIDFSAYMTEIDLKVLNSNDYFHWLIALDTDLE